MNALSPVSGFYPAQLAANAIVPPDLKRVWDQAALAQDEGDASWFFDPFMQKALRYVIAGQTSETGETDKKKHGGWELAIHQAGCAHIVYNFPDDRDDETRWIDTLAILFHDEVEDRIKKAMKAAEASGQKFSFQDVDRLAQQIYQDIRKICADAFIFQQVCLRKQYLTDAPGLTGDLRLDDQIAKSFDPETGACVLSPSKQILRAADKIEQLNTDVRARKLGLLPDEALPKQIANAIKRTYILRFPEIRKHPEIIEKYNDNITYLENELKMVALSQMSSPIHSLFHTHALFILGRARTAVRTGLELTAASRKAVQAGATRLLAVCSML